MARWGLVIDLARCTACQACVVACKTENNVPYSSPEDAARGRTTSWMEILWESHGEFPSLRGRFLPRPCFHCDNPPCTKVCPVFATYKDPEGIVAQIYPRCIGCRYCTTACPYTVKYFNWFAPRWRSPLEGCLNPDVSVRPRGVVEKCTFCHHRLMRAKEQAKAESRDVGTSDYQPACVESCPADALFFGDLDDHSTEVAKLAHHPRAFRYFEDLGTEPKVYYLPE